MSDALPRLSDVFAGRARRAAFLQFWQGMTLNDWRDVIVVALLRRLPIDFCSAFGAVSASVRGPKIYREADQRARNNLANLRPDLDAAERERRLMARWRCVGRTMAEFAVLDRMIARGRVQFEGLDNLVKVATEGRGYVVVTLHLGNWEASVVSAQFGYPVSTFYEPRPTRGREYISRSSRQRIGVRLLAPSPTGMRSALRILKSGGMVAIFGDEEVDGVVRGPLFGRPPFARSNLAYAVRLARRADAPILIAYVLREQGAHLRTVVVPAFRLVDAPCGSDTLVADIQRVNDEIEPIVLAHLDQWYFLHERLDVA